MVEDFLLKSNLSLLNSGSPTYTFTLLQHLFQLSISLSSIWIFVGKLIPIYMVVTTIQ